MTKPIRCFHLDHSYDAHSLHMGGGPCCFVHIPDVNNFQQLHQHPDYIEIKQQFWKGNWPDKYCNECKRIEETSSGLSKRQHSAMLYEKITNKNQTVRDCRIPVSDTMYSLIVNTGALCNLQCRSCSPWLSSSWIKEYNQLPDKFRTVGNFINLNDVTTGLPYQFDDDLSNIREIGLIGGEPMYNPTAYNLLEKVYNATGGNATVTFTTNGTIMFDTKKYSWLSKFRRIVLIVSLDASGKASDYIRTGSSWKTIEQNIQAYVNMPNIRVEYHPTYSVLNIFEIEKLLKWGDTIGISPTNEVTYVEHPRYLSYDILTDSEKTFVIDYLNSINQRTVAKCVANSNFSQAERNKFNNFMEHTKQYHDMDWKDYLPELHNLLNTTCL